MENRVDTLETTVEQEEEIKMHLMLCDYNGEEEDIKKVDGETQEEEEEPTKLKTLKLSLQSKEWFTSNKSFKVWVQIGDRQVVTLMNSSATSNFITTKLVEQLQLKVVDTPTYVIEVGNGENVINQGVCNDLSFKIQDVEFNQHFFIMDLGGSEMVLGVDWLASLGNIEANFENLCLKWKKNGHNYLIQGDPTMCNRQASWKAMIKAMSNDGVGFYLHTVIDE
ncbi:hypothetical protein QL285_089616 [Trifolium repens]|nr:hypothetical protein QL285_089616 [Trifolium repens]